MSPLLLLRFRHCVAAITVCRYAGHYGEWIIEPGHMIYACRWCGLVLNDIVV